MPLSAIRSSTLLRSLLAGFGLLLATQAEALPVYARQTGQDCSACHIGAFGPQLTAYGQRFKLGGYSDGDRSVLPLSGMFVGSFTHTKSDQEEAPAEHFDTNNNLAAQEGSLFLAGRIADHFGSFAQLTWSGIDRALAWDNLDLRYARDLTTAGKDLTLGLSLNNNPGIQDPFNTLPAWGFPYVSSELAPAPPTAPLLAGGLETQVLGLNAYALFDQRWYAEAGAYRSPGHSLLHKFGVPEEDILKTSGLSPYLRLAYTRDLHRQSYSFGVVGMQSSLATPGSAKHDRYTDVGIDGSYQFLGTRRDVFTANALAVREKQNLAGTFDAGDADNRNQTLTSLNLNLSYYRAQTWGGTLGLFSARGSTDASLHGDSASGKPNTSGEILQLDYTPFGKEGSWLAPNMNLRLGLQYTAYNRFNGGSSNYDGAGRKASSNNTLAALVWLAF
jgi:hypothetical protein